MDLEFKKSQNRKVTIFAIILSVISIGLLVVGFLFVSSDKVVMLQSVSNLSSKLENMVLKDSDLYDKVANSNDLGVRTTVRLTSDYMNAGLELDYLENKADQKSQLNANLLVNDQNVLAFDGALADDQMYMYVADITPTYYHTPLEYISFLSSLERNDYDKLLTMLKSAITDYIDEDAILKEKVEILYNGKAKKVNKLSYPITNQVMAEVSTNFITLLKQDKELLTNLAKYFDVTSTEIETELDRFVESLTYDTVEVACYYNVYYYGFNKIVGYELADANNRPVLAYKTDQKETIHFYLEEETVFSLEITKNKTQYDFNGFVKDTENMEEIQYHGTLQGNTLTIVTNQDDVDIQFVITSEEEVKDNRYLYQTQITLSGVADGVEVTVGTLEFDLEYYFNEKVDVDLSNSVDVSEITEEDMAIIQNNIMNHPIYQLFSNLFQTSQFSL